MQKMLVAMATGTGKTFMMETWCIV
ncbi:MAG: hypothetical protein GXY48_13220 [Methanomicrobiales archaeon]|nr:hypothetical protein [Methanomicrobiales archaeon]